MTLSELGLSNPLEDLRNSQKIEKRIDVEILNPNEEWTNKDLSSCILKSDPECDLSSKYMVDMQLTYFCGSSIEVYFLDLNLKNPITQVGV